MLLSFYCGFGVIKNMDITSAQFIKTNDINVSIVVVSEGITLSVPLDPKNRHYAIIMEKVDAGTLTIAEDPGTLTIAEADNG
jgi:hypothetical protein